MRSCSHANHVGCNLLKHSIHQVIHSLRELNIKLSHPTRIMRRQLKSHFGVTNQNIWVVLSLFGNLRKIIHEINRIIELLKLNCASHGTFFKFPFWAFFKSCGEFVFIEKF